MALNSFTPNTKIKSSEQNANWSNFSDHGRNVTMKWFVPGTLATQNVKDYMSFSDDVLIDRVDIAVETAPTGAAIIVDIERSTDGGANFTTIFTGGTNRPQIAAGARTGNTTTIDVPSATANSHIYRAVISQVGSSVAGANLSIMMRGKYVLD